MATLESDKVSVRRYLCNIVVIASFQWHYKLDRQLSG